LAVALEVDLVDLAVGEVLEAVVDLAVPAQLAVPP
jgi:hypothetical protein